MTSQPKSSKQPRLIGVSQAAQECGVTEKTIRKWIAEGRIPAYRLGEKMLRIDGNEIMSRLAKRIPTR